MQHYLPKFYVSNPVLDYERHKFDYEMTSLVFDSFNVTYSVVQNISLLKTVVFYDDQIAFEGDPYRDESYSFNRFTHNEVDTWENNPAIMSYNLSFANSYQVHYFTVQGDKFY